MSLGEKETRDSRIEMSKQFDFLKPLRLYFQSMAENINRVEIECGRWIVSSSLINDRD